MHTDGASQTLTDLDQQVHRALSLWHKSPARGSPLDQLLIVQQALRENGGNLRLATNQVLHRALTIMTVQNADLATLLRVRFLDRKTVHALAIERNLAEATLYLQQSRAFGLLAAAVQQMELAARNSVHHDLEKRLPPASYVSLVGASGYLEFLLERIAAPDGPSLVLLEGIGGIGKTSLAHALVRRVMKRPLFDDIAWITAQQQCLRLDATLSQIPRSVLHTEGFVGELLDQLLPGSNGNFSPAQALAVLRDHLAHRLSLIVVDNLEEFEDPGQLFSLVRQLAGHSRFVLISRHCYFGETNAYHFRLAELSESDAMSLVRLEAKQRNLPDLVDAPDEDLCPVFATVGGNPLALRLIVEQVHVRPLPAVLAELTTARGEVAEALYTYVYRNAWNNLDERCRQILLAMPLVAEAGGTLEHLAQVSSIALEELSISLGVLVERNLVDSIGNHLQRRYAISNLTRSFLREQALQRQA